MQNLSARTITYIPTYIQQEAKLLVYLYLETALHVSIATHHQEHTQLYLQHLALVKLLLLPAAIMEELELFHDSGK